MVWRIGGLGIVLGHACSPILLHRVHALTYHVHMYGNQQNNIEIIESGINWLPRRPAGQRFFDSSEIEQLSRSATILWGSHAITSLVNLYYKYLRLYVLLQLPGYKHRHLSSLDPYDTSDKILKTVYCNAESKYFWWQVLFSRSL
jgi:hypothetical protein